MRTAYLWLARTIGVLVAIQAALIVFAISGLFHWIDEGGVVDNATVDGWQDTPPTFTGAIGHFLHSVIGERVFPVVVLLFLIVGFLVKTKPLVIFPIVIAVLTGVQIYAGMQGDAIPYLGLVHGLNAFLIFGAATAAAMTAKKPVAA